MGSPQATRHNADGGEEVKANYDHQQVALTREFVAVLKRLMKAECEMMGKRQPGDAECWWGGTCKVEDLAQSNGLYFYYFSKGDRPKGQRERFVVETPSPREEE